MGSFCHPVLPSMIPTRGEITLTLLSSSFSSNFVERIGIESFQRASYIGDSSIKLSYETGCIILLQPLTSRS